MHIDICSRQRRVLGNINLKNQDLKLHPWNDRNYANIENENRKKLKGNLSKLLKRSPLEARISFHPSVFAKSSVIGM